MGPETSLRSIAARGRLSIAHVERFASDLAQRQRGAPATAVGQRANAVASAMLELELLGHGALVAPFLSAWLEPTGAFELLAKLRPQVAREALALVDVLTVVPGNRARCGLTAEDLEIARALEIARRYIGPVRPAAVLITHGLSGAGKTTLADAVCGPLGALLVRNDVEHVRLRCERSSAGSDEALPPGALIDRLERLAALTSVAGWPVIVESCFLTRTSRERFRAKADELGVPFAILHCAAPLPAIRERLDKRRAFGSLFHGEDASTDDADRALAAQLERSEPLADGEQARTLCVDTGQPVDGEALAARIHAMLA